MINEDPTYRERDLERDSSRQREREIALLASGCLGGASLSTARLTGPLSAESLAPASASVPSAARMHKRKVLRGYALQSAPVVDRLDAILSSFEARHESLVIEGVHIGMDDAVKLMRKHPSCIPFLIYIRSAAPAPSIVSLVDHTYSHTPRALVPAPPTILIARLHLARGLCFPASRHRHHPPPGC
jgi:hypothetical protein